MCIRDRGKRREEKGKREGRRGKERCSARTRDEDVVRLKVLSAKACALPHDEGRHETRASSCDVHDVATRKVQDASLEEKPVRHPHRVRDRTVDNEMPDSHEEEHGAEAHAIGEGSRNERGSNDREHELVDHKEGLRNFGV
eukprot:405014-Rhodomonas_salina.1